MLKIGILGAGGIANVHARHLHRLPDVELLFVERDIARAKEFAAKHEAKPLDSADDLISKSDLLWICLPSDLHYEYGLRCIAAGKATFVEKPITKSLEDGAKVVEAATKANIPLGVAHVVRWFPEFREGHNIVASGKIGTPAAARTRRGGPAPRKGADDWFMDHTRSGGVLLDLAVHDFDWLRWTLGEVKHLYSRSVGTKTMKGPDYALTTLTFDSGAVAHVEATWMDAGGFRTTFEVCGSGGMIEFDSRTVPTLRTSVEGKPTISEAPLALDDDPYYKQILGFVNAVRQGKEPPVTGHDGLMALSIALAAIESAKTDKVLCPPRQF